MAEQQDPHTISGVLNAVKFALVADCFLATGIYAGY